MIPLSWRLKLPLRYFCFLIPLNQQARKGVTLLAGVIDPDYPGETELFHSARKIMSGIQILEGYLLVLLCLMIKVSGITSTDSWLEQS